MTLIKTAAEALAYLQTWAEQEAERANKHIDEVDESYPGHHQALGEWQGYMRTASEIRWIRKQVARAVPQEKP